MQAQLGTRSDVQPTPQLDRDCTFASPGSLHSTGAGQSSFLRVAPDAAACCRFCPAPHDSILPLRSATNVVSTPKLVNSVQRSQAAALLEGLERHHQLTVTFTMAVRVFRAALGL